MRLVPRRPNRVLSRDIDAGSCRLKSIGLLATLRTMAPWHRDPELMSGLTLHAGPRSLLGWLRHVPRPNNITRFAYLIIPAGEDRPVGLIVVAIEPDRSASGHVAITDRKWRGSPLAADARAALIDVFFRDAGVTKFSSQVDSRNTASVFVYKRLGFRIERTIKNYATDAITGRSIDKIVFVLGRADWDRQRAAIAAQGATHERV